MTPRQRWVQRVVIGASFLFMFALIADGVATFS